MTLLAKDTFTDTHPTNLTAHTADTGDTWAAGPGSGNTLVINAYTNGTGVATDASAGSTGEALISTALGSADYTVLIKINLGDNSFTEFPGVIARASNSAYTEYRCYLNLPGGGFARVDVDKVVAGTQASIGSTAGTTATHNGDTLQISLQVTGTSLTATLTNVTTSTSENATFTDSSISATGQAGLLHQFHAAGPYEVITYFELDGTAAVGPAGPPFICRRFQSLGRRR